mgnify:CR=1 FL=1
MDRHDLRLVVAVLAWALFLGTQRVIPHPPNFTPIITSAVFVPWLFGRNAWAIGVSMLGLFIGDLVWGFHPYMLYTYASLILAGLVTVQVRHLPTLAVLGSTIFFLVTNLGVWLSGYYGYTLQGLWTCYVMAIPFFANTLASTLVYTLVFWVLYKLVAHFYPRRQTS